MKMTFQWGFNSSQLENILKREKILNNAIKLSMMVLTKHHSVWICHVKTNSALQ